MRTFIYILICCSFLLFGYVIGRYRIKTLISKEYFKEIFQDHAFVNIEKCPYPGKIWEVFYLTWKKREGTFAIREVRQGFEGYFDVYWIVEDGKAVALSVDNTTFFSTFHTHVFDTLLLGYDDSEGKFIQVCPEELKQNELRVIGK